MAKYLKQNKSYFLAVALFGSLLLNNSCKLFSFLTTDNVSYAGTLFPKSFTVNGKDYEAGFYENWLYNQHIISKENYLGSGKEVYKKIDFYKVPHESLDLITYCVHETGYREEQPLYILKGQYKKAQNYYANPANWTYWYFLGSPYEHQADIQIYDIDGKKFNELIDFAQTHQYVPFAFTNNKEVEKNYIYKTIKKSDLKEIVFYKKSIDNLLTSPTGGCSFTIVDGKFYFLNSYEPKEASVEEFKLTLTNLPSELESYFYNYSKNLL